jgi:hypothetical protein
MENTAIIKAIQDRLAKVGREIDTHRRALADLEAESAKLQTAAEVILGMQAKTQTGERQLTIRDHIMQCFEDGAELALKDVTAMMAVHGEFKYASVAAELSRLSKSGDLVRSEDGKYKLPHQDEARGSANAHAEDGSDLV